MSRFARAGREPGICEFLVLHRQVLEHAFGRGDLVHGGEVDIAKLFNVHWSAILQTILDMTERREGSMYFICLVVVLWVVFKDLGFLLVIEVAYEIIEAEIFAPFLAFNKPYYELACFVSDGLPERTSSQSVRHRTCELVEIAAGRCHKPEECDKTL